jgi:uncharacterized membrane protein YheB (UPF0754 family)
MDWQAILDDVQTNLWIYLSLPLVSALVGYGTNVLAIRMMFRPMEFVGLPPYLGWQGVIPRKAAKMAGIAVETMTTKLLSVREVFGRLDPDRVARELEQPMLQSLERITRGIAERYYPGLWETVPEFLRQRVIRRVQDESPGTVAELMQELKDNIDRVFDLRHMVVSNLVRDKALLNRIFYETGHREFTFIGNCGLYFGLLFGVTQMLIWIFYQAPWQLPAFGLLVGCATNWIALWMIFEPQQPRRMLGLTVQGLFLKRQQEVARDYGKLIADELLTPEKVWDALLRGPASDRLFEMVARHVKQAVDESAGMARPMVAFAIGSKNYVEMKNAVADAWMKELPETLQHVNEYAEDAMDIRNTLITKMQQLSPVEFVNMLRPVFKEDEWILIAVGAALGFSVGCLQVLVLT